ncbi:hypothetical protein KL86CLO1_12357 [uncultured Eubacteriales bacterium]|uniref:Uncharacterized protein n=1 Tax=uncultured Eubacteriales bacterium TaxID=172733 RepID=A0A212K7Z8_9FIRM|nr:hypothetical protein KL86CLO1_12357 [uncultured Eubacteriales bacterium]
MIDTGTIESGLIRALTSTGPICVFGPCCFQFI